MRIAIWYHCLLSGPRIPSEDHALAVLQSQMSALAGSGLAAAAQEIHLGINDTDGSALLLCAFAPEPGKTQLKVYADGQSELTTLRDLQAWLKPGWFVFYHHIKGVSYPGNPVWERWRKCMERVCVLNWPVCVSQLESGADTVGAHWITHAKYASSGVGKDQRYWGGNFWWATSDYLLTLPPLPQDSVASRYLAEDWIGKSPRNPVVVDFADHFPTNCPV